MNDRAASAQQTGTRYGLLGIVVLGVLYGLMGADPGIDNVALVDGARDLGMSVSEHALAGSMSMLSLAATVMLVGSIADQIGLRKALVFSLILTTAGNLIAAAATGPLLFMLGRIVCGIGLGGIFVGSFGLIKFVSRPERLGRDLGIWLGVCWAVVLIMSVLAGVVNDAASWRIAMLIVPVVAGILIPVCFLVLPEPDLRMKEKPQRIGLIFLAIGMVGLLYGLSEAAVALTSPGTWIPIGIGVIAMVCWVVFESKAKRPVFPIWLFRSRIFVAAVIAGIVYNIVISVVLLQTVNLWEFLYRYDSTQVTLGQLPFNAGAAVMSFIIGGLLARGLRNRTSMIIGSLVMAAGFLLLLVTSAATPFIVFGASLTLIAVGMTFVQAPQARIYVQSAPDEYVGPVASSRVAWGQLGYAVGIAGSSALVTQLGVQDLWKQLRESGIPPDRYGKVVNDTQTIIATHETTGIEHAQEIVSGLQQAFLHSFVTTMLITAMICVGLAAVSWWLLRKADMTPEPQSTS